jgi:hypothetical protein
LFSVTASFSDLCNQSQPSILPFHHTRRSRSPRLELFTCLAALFFLVLLAVRSLGHIPLLLLVFDFVLKRFEIGACRREFFFLLRLFI